MAELVAIKDITIEEGLHCRDGLNMDAVSRYSEIFDALPPIKLVRDGDTLLLASGHHRYASYANAGTAEHLHTVDIGSIAVVGTMYEGDVMPIFVDRECTGS